MPRRRLNGTWEPETAMLTEKPKCKNHKGESTEAESQERNSAYELGSPHKGMERRRCVMGPDSMSQPAMEEPD